jgi:lipoprotein-anchoring transpeptidase ErfK/SrfK
VPIRYLGQGGVPDDLTNKGPQDRSRISLLEPYEVQYWATLYRIHGTNQPEWIGHAISSGCIRLTNEDVIDLYNRVKTGALVVVLGPKQGPARVASAGSSAPN